MSESNAAASQWDELVAHSPDGGLLQSSVWAAFQEALRRQVAFLRIANSHESTNTSAQALVVEQRLPLGFSYVYSPRGPVVENLESGICLPSRDLPKGENLGLDALIAEVQRRFPKAIFWRIEPPYADNYLITQLLNYPMRRAPRDVQPATTLVIDLTKSEAELLAAMKEKTRYNIRLAQRHGVSVRSSNDAADVERFLELLEETAKRDHFRAHPREYYATMLGARSFDAASARGGSAFGGQDDNMVLFVAECGGKMLAAAIVTFFGKWTYYLHGASSSEHREFMAPYALHWQIMREAKRRGCTHYDLWGISPADSQLSLRGPTAVGPWQSRLGSGLLRRLAPRNDTREDRLAGVTRFKTGFAPQTKPTTFVGTWDVPFSPFRYSLYRGVQRWLPHS